MAETTFTVRPIGHVARDGDGDGDGDGATICINESYRAGLAGLGDFSHVVVLWWADRCDDPEARKILNVALPYAENREVGVFACRAPVRPNTIMTTVCAIDSLDEANGAIRVRNIDAAESTPVIDLKPYYGITDRVREPVVPGYVADWPTWLPEEGTGLMPHEQQKRGR